jgi:1-acyl-sn-glycerol-3-phosphate acyltransferase
MNDTAKNYLFPTDTYYTGDNSKRVFLDKLACNTRLYFVLKYASLLIKSRQKALKEIYDSRFWATHSYEVLKLIENCGGRFHITGIDNLYLKQPVVFTSNHMGTLETMVFPCLIRPVMDVTFVVKESLVKHPLFGPIMKSTHPIVIGRSNSRDDFKTVMEKGMELLSSGTSIIIFPEGTRKATFIPKDFNSMGVKLAKKAGVSVLPIAIKTDFWGNGKIVKEIGPLHRERTIHMAFGKPMDVKGTGKEENETIIDFISSNLTQWNGDII